MAAGDAGRAPTAAAEQSLVESFCAVTSATPEEAAFFLESHNWALDSAVRSFYDSADGDAADPAPPPPLLPADGGGADSEDEDYVRGGGDEDDEDYAGDDDGDDEDAALAAAAAAAEEKRRPVKRQKRSHDAIGGSGSASGSSARAGGASARGNVKTLADLGGGKRGAGSDEDSEEDDEWAPPPEYYTGGEKSGMVVRDRPKRKNDADEVFKQTKRKGAKQGLFEARRRSSSSGNFTGTGRLLTGETVQRDAPRPSEEIVHNICFWSNGFTVNGGLLRSFDDPANASFLESIKNSDCPIELEPADGKSKVNVNLVRKEEEYTGERRTLGAPSYNTSNAAPSSTATSDNTSNAAPSSMSTTGRTITVDDSLPSTSLRIRFADGSRLVAHFNTSHTISDVRRFIDATRPEAGDYTLQAGFPPKPLDDATKTIEEAGVANSVIIQTV